MYLQAERIDPDQLVFQMPVVLDLHCFKKLGHLPQSVMCLTADACLAADPGVVSLIPAGPILSWRLIMK